MECLELQFPPLPQLLTIGHAVNRSGWQHFKRRFDVYDLLLIRRGTFYMTEENCEYEVGEGSILLLEPGLTHFGHRPLDEDTELYWVHFRHAPPLRRLDSTQINWSQPIVQGTDDDTEPAEQSLYLPKFGRVDISSLLPTLDEMVRLHRSLSNRNALPLQAQLAQLLVQLQDTLRARIESKAYRVSELAAAYIYDHFLQPFNGKAMEDALHYHFDYIARCLKKHTGMSPLQYHHHLQIEEAKRLLSHTELSVQEIGEMIGYAQTNYFIRLFRQLTSVTPGAYRDRRRKGQE